MRRVAVLLNFWLHLPLENLALLGGHVLHGVANVLRDLSAAVALRALPPPDVLQSEVVQGRIGVAFRMSIRGTTRSHVLILELAVKLLAREVFHR